MVMKCCRLRFYFILFLFGFRLFEEYLLLSQSLPPLARFINDCFMASMWTIMGSRVLVISRFEYVNAIRIFNNVRAALW